MLSPTLSFGWTDAARCTAGAGTLKPAKRAMN